MNRSFINLFCVFVILVEYFRETNLLASYVNCVNKTIHQQLFPQSSNLFSKKFLTKLIIFYLN